jgi:hypothetical protein
MQATGMGGNNSRLQEQRPFGQAVVWEVRSNYNDMLSSGERIAVDCKYNAEIGGSESSRCRHKIIDIEDDISKETQTRLDQMQLSLCIRSQRSRIQPRDTRRVFRVCHL